MNKGGTYLSFAQIAEDIKKELYYDGEVVVAGVNVDYNSEIIYIRYYTEDNVVTNDGEFIKLNK